MKETQEFGKDITQKKEIPSLFLKGFLMGSADIIPGVSGGTMALIVGIYERLLAAIKSVDIAVIKDLLTFKIKPAFSRIHSIFLAVLLSGILAAVLFFTRVVPLQVYMFTHPEIIYGLFFGLIGGSVYVLYKELAEVSAKVWAGILAGCIIGFWIVNLVPADTPEHPAFIFLSGMIAICAMILPGISGSYLLLILRKYDFILMHIGNLGSERTLESVLALIPFGVGAIAGISLFSRLLSWLLFRFHTITLSILIGFLIGSLSVVWPFQEREYHEQVRSVEVLDYSSERVQQLLRQPEPEDLPEYQRIGNIINPNASFDAFKKAEVETVKKKLIQSRPQLPDSKNSAFAGFLSILTGLVFVVGIDKLRKA